MTKPTLNGKLALVAVLLFFISGSALFWLVSFGKPHDMLPRLGFLCAVFCVMGSLIVSWSVCFARMAQKRGWSSQTCMKSGLPFVIAGLVLFVVGGDRLASQIGSLLACNSIFAGFITRRLVYPDLTDEEAISQKPLSLFPR
jgi:hypothetical protein